MPDRHDTILEEQSRRAAIEFRQQHGLGLGPIKDVADLVQMTVNADVALVNLPDFLDSMISVDKTAGAALIAVRTTDNPERQRFSIAHELGHYIFDEFSARLHEDDDPAMESRANSFARHLLLPHDALDDFLTTADATYRKLELPERALSSVVAFFEVSGAVAAIQLRQTGWISSEQYEEWKGIEASYLAKRYGWAAERDRRVDDAKAERPPRRMLDNATEAYIDHLLSVETLAHIGGSAVGELQASLEADGIRPREVTVTPVDLDDLGFEE